MNDKHINLSIDMSKYNKGTLDLRVSNDQSVQELYMSLFEVFYIPMPTGNSSFAIRVDTKEIVVFDTDLLKNHPIVDGDHITLI